MKQFLTVLKFELNNYFKNKSFTATTVVMVLLMVGVIVVPTLIPGLLKGDSGQAQGGGKHAALAFYGAEGAVADTESLLSGMDAEWTVCETADEVRDLVKTEAVEAGFLLDSPKEVTYVVNNMGVNEGYSDAFAETLTQYQKQEYLLEKGLSEDEITEAQNMQVTMNDEILGKNSARNYMYTYILIFVTYLMILLYGQMIATAITTEKSNRAIEILVTSVHPNSLIFGKVLAGAIAGVLQVALILGSGFAAYAARKEAWGGMLDFLFDIPANVMASYAVFGLLSYLLYAFIYGILGALVSKTEDISKSASTITIIYMASFFVALFGMNSSDSLMVRVASYIPFTSGNAMFVRVAMGTVAVWEVVVSGVLLAASCVVAGVLAGRLFRFGTLQYGNPIKFTAALKTIRQK